jgi:hypothetical protein
MTEGKLTDVAINFGRRHSVETATFFSQHDDGRENKYRFCRIILLYSEYKNIKDGGHRIPFSAISFFRKSKYRSKQDAILFFMKYERQQCLPNHNHCYFIQEQQQEQ